MLPELETTLPLITRDLFDDVGRYIDIDDNMAHRLTRFSQIVLHT
jgi:hypothetical protein